VKLQYDRSSRKRRGDFFSKDSLFGQNRFLVFCLQPFLKKKGFLGKQKEKGRTVANKSREKWF
jgi:hypothetical protein